MVHVGSSTTDTVAVVSVSFFDNDDSADVEFFDVSDLCFGASVGVGVVVVFFGAAVVVVFWISVSLFKRSKNWSDSIRNSDFGQQLQTREDSSRSLNHVS